MFDNSENAFDYTLLKHRIETPAERRARYTLVSCRISTLCGLLMAVGSGLMGLLVDWQLWSGTLLAGTALTALGFFCWRLAVTGRSALAARLGCILVITVITIMFWTRPYFANFFAFILILVAAIMVLNLWETLAAGVFLMGNTLLHALLNNNLLYGPDNTAIQADLGTLALWWVFIALTCWLVYYLHANLGRDNVILLGQAEELKKIQALLKRSEQRFRAVIENLTEVIAVYDREGILIYTSPAQERVTGYGEEWLGKSFWNFIYPEDQPKIRESLTRLRDGDRVLSLLFRYKHQNGDWHWAEGTATNRLNDPAVQGIVVSYRDITERKQAEEALQESEARFRIIFDTAPVALTITDQDGRYLAVNPYFLKAVRVTSEQVIGHTYEQVAGLSSAAERAITIRQKLAESKGELDNLEISQLAPDGREIVTLTSARLLRIGGQVRNLSITTDITGIKQAEKARRQSEERYRLLAQNLPGSAIILFDHDLRMVLVDGPEIESTGYSKATTEGKTIYESLPPEFVAQIEPLMRTVLAGETVEQILPFADNRVFHYNTLPLRNERGEVEYGLTLARNITEQVRAEEALRESEARYSTVVNQAYDGVIIVQDGRIIFANAALAGILGYPLAELLGAEYRTYVLPESQEALLNRVRDRAEGREIPPLFEIKLLRRDGTTIETELADATITHAGRNATLAFVRNIGERKRAEAEREQLIRELEDRNAELERFTYTVSHDLKSPLITITGFLGYLEQDALEGNRDRLKADISRIGGATRKMQNLLNDLLELSRIGRKMNRPEIVPFSQIVKEALELAEGRLVSGKIQLEIDPDLPDVYCDRLRLVEVIQNLLENAVKFMGSQPAPQITIGHRPEASGPAFFVRDNGQGIEPRYLTEIFGLFEKLDPRSEGTGIGLALCKRIIEVHGGQIWAESAGHGQGTTFYFTLGNLKE